MLAICDNGERALLLCRVSFLAVSPGRSTLPASVPESQEHARCCVRCAVCHVPCAMRCVLCDV